MFCRNSCEIRVCVRLLFVCVLSFSVAVFPLLPVGARADETAPVKVEGQTKELLQENEKTPVLTDNKKEVVAKETEVIEPETKQSASEPAVDEPSDGEWSTMTKVGIGAGVVAVIGVAAIALGGGSDDPAIPTPEDLLGVWNSVGTSLTDNRSYRGSYNLYAVGSHTYDIVVSDGVRKRGQGTWDLAEGTYTLVLKNDTGSVYVGDFLDENFSHIVLTTTNGRWQVVLDKM